MTYTKRGEEHHGWRPALERFAEKCAFDPYTGCVMWIAGKTSGRGHNEPYGTFWDQGQMWKAHRWSAINIHGFDITGLTVDHNCPAGPSTLCVQHLKPETSEINRLLQHVRPGRAFQDLDTKRFWIYVQKGLEEYRPRDRDTGWGEPVFLPPTWLLPFMPKFKPMEISDACPF